MFQRRKTGLLDFLATALALWAALYHTPIGALGRDLFATLHGGPSRSQPLLTYYSGGVYDAQATPNAVSPLSPRPRPGLAPTPGQALGYGAYAVWVELPADQQAAARSAAKARGLDAAGLASGRSGEATGPPEMSRLIAQLSRELSSEDAAVLAVFAGEDVARYARDRVRASDEVASLESLQRVLPPDTAGALGRASRALTLGTAYGLGWPVPAPTFVTSPFGWRTNPVTGRRQLHSGVDLGVPSGTPIVATADGVVRRASEDAVNGKVLILDHGHGVTTAYCHNSELLVEVEQRMERGAMLSRSGSTGRSTGPHLHYQLELGHAPVDPLLFRSPHSSARTETAKMAVGAD